MKNQETGAYQRRVDKTSIPTCNIMGVRVAAIDMEWLVDYLKTHVRELSGDYICVSNVHTTVTAYEEEDYCRIQNGGLMAIPDGGPLSSIGRKRGHERMARTTGPSLMGEIFAISAQQGYRHYFYGSTGETLERLRTALEKAYPGIDIAGMYSPPFRALTEDEDAAVVRQINEARPDFIWVGLGAPKQERWMATHGAATGAKLLAGLGGSLDVFAGVVERAPKFWCDHGLEWFYRLCKEPKRIGRMMKLPLFLIHVKQEKRK